MAKAKQKTGQKISEAKVIDIDSAVEKYFFLIIPVLTIIYYLISKVSLGFYQDDEIGQYINMVDFWNDPAVILGNNPKPGWKIFMVIPALFGYNAVLIANSLIASLAVFFTFKMLRVYSINYAFFGALLLATQPLFFDLSFRSYSEIFTALLFTIFFILYKKERYFWSSFLLGYIFTVRQETAFLLLIYVIMLIYKKEYVPVLGVVIAPLMYNIFGYFKTGEVLYILSEMTRVAGLEYTTQGPLHYFKFYIFIIGPVCIMFFLLGFFGFLADSKNQKLYFRNYLLLYITFVTVFAFQIITTLGSGPNPGNWRYLLHISPVAVFFATVGLNNLVIQKFRTYSYVVSGLLLFLTFVFLSKVSDGFVFKEPAETDYTKAIFLALSIAVISIFSIKKPKDYLNKVSLSLIALAIIYLSLDFKPKQMSQENLTVKATSEYLSTMNIPPDAKIYTNHLLIKFFFQDYKNFAHRFSPIKSNTDLIENAPKGSIIIWEPHYGFRIWGSDTAGYIPKLAVDNNLIRPEIVKANPNRILDDTINFKDTKQIISPDKRSFITLISEKK